MQRRLKTHILRTPEKFPSRRIGKELKKLSHLLRNTTPYIVDYAEISRKQDPSYREKIARFVFENYD
jgi:hypothetical protein